MFTQGKCGLTLKQKNVQFIMDTNGLHTILRKFWYSIQVDRNSALMVLIKDIIIISKRYLESGWINEIWDFYKKYILKKSKSDQNFKS